MAEFKEGNFKVGDTIKILQKPTPWSSKLCDNCPFDLNYPQKFQIEEIKEYGNHTAMRAKGEDGISYGFDLSYLLIENNIFGEVSDGKLEAEEVKK